MTDEEGMTLALVQAQRAREEGEWPFGTVIVAGNEVIAQNRCAETAQRNVLAHAELQAVGDACVARGSNELHDCTIYCTNEPCLMCASAIFQAKIARVVIGATRRDVPHLLRPRQLGITDLAADAGYGPVIEVGVAREAVIALFADIQKT